MQFLFKLNDWDRNLFLLTVIIFTGLATLIFLAGSAGIDITGLRQLIGFIYLAFIPGYALLRLLRIHKQDTAETLLYALGLSLSFDIFVGLAINTIGPFAGNNRPLSLPVLVSVFSILIIAIAIIAYIRDKDFVNPIKLQFSFALIFHPIVLFSVLIVCLSIMGALLVNIYQNNLLLIVLIFLVGAMVILSISKKVMPSELYPLVIFCVALALIWHESLISNYLNGASDLFVEHYLLAITNNANYWFPNYPHIYNSALSITILPTVFVQIMVVDTQWAYKLIFPLFYAFIPIAVFCICRSQLSDNEALLATFLFIFNTWFFTVLPGLARQGIGELFLLLIITVLLPSKLHIIQNRILLILFSFTLIVSHYALTYLFIITSIISLLLMPLIKIIEKSPESISNASINYGWILLLIIGAGAWYMYSSSEAAFQGFIFAANSIWEGTYEALFGQATQDFVFVFTSPSMDIYHMLYKTISYLILLLISCGVIKLIQSVFTKTNRFSVEYTALLISFFSILGLSIVIPFFSNQVGTERLFHIATLLICPLFVMGSVFIIEIVTILLKKSMVFFSVLKRINFSFALPAILILFLFFSTGLIFEVCKSKYPTSIPLSFHRQNNYEVNLENIINMEAVYVHDQEVKSAQWLGNNWDTNMSVWATYRNITHNSLTGYGLVPTEQTWAITETTALDLLTGDYVYLGYVNIHYELGTNALLTGKLRVRPTKAYWDFKPLMTEINKNNLIYANIDSQIYQIR